MSKIRSNTGERCDFCDGLLYPKTVSIELRIKDQLIVIEGVPAEVCNRCGQKYFAADTDASIEKILSTRPDADKTITVPVFEWEPRVA